MADAQAAVTIDDVVTYLEMTERPVRPRVPAPAIAKMALMAAEHCTVSFYRYLYNTVGEPWLWFERRQLSDDALRAAIDRPEIEIGVLYAGGVPAGYFELDCSDGAHIELAYFGLVPDFIGRGLGPYLLQAALDAAWVRHPQRVWVHTCTFDHPKALNLYQRAGFRVYQRRAVSFPDPRLSGVLPRTLRHPLLPPLA